MDSAALNAITDLDTLRSMVREQWATITLRDDEIAFKDAKIDKLTHEIARLHRVQFAAKSERMDPA